MFTKVKKCIKRNKTGKVIKATAAVIAVMALVPNANAAVNLHIVPDPLNSNIGGAIIQEDNTIASFAGTNGWRPVRDVYSNPLCTSQGAWDNVGTPVIHAFSTLTGHGLLPPYMPQGAQIMAAWSHQSITWSSPPVYIMHAKISCKMVKNVVTYQWRVRSGHRVRVRIVTRIHNVGIGQF